MEARLRLVSVFESHSVGYGDGKKFHNKNFRTRTLCFDYLLKVAFHFYLTFDWNFEK